MTLSNQETEMLPNSLLAYSGLFFQTPKGLYSSLPPNFYLRLSLLQFAVHKLIKQAFMATRGATRWGAS